MIAPSLYSRIKVTMSSLSRRSSLSSFYSQPLPDNSKAYAQEVSSDIISIIIDRAVNRVVRNATFKDNLKRYSEIKTINNINEINKLQFFDFKNSLGLSHAGKQPSPLLVDSLLPISADIDRENLYKKGLRSMSDIKPKQSSFRKQQNFKESKKEVYMKLDFETAVEDDGFIKELRKIQEDRVKKEQEERKMKLMEEKLLKEKLRASNKDKQEKISYDYNGTPLKVRTDPKSNLISKVINGNMNNRQILNKQAINDPNPSMIDEFSSVFPKKNSAGSIIKKKDEVEFNEVRSLADSMHVGVGIKYTYEGKVMQQKVKSISTKELKKTINTRRLTKEEFERVRSMNGSALELSREDLSFRQTKHKRSQSENNLLKSKKEPIKVEKIIVNNQALKDKMLQKSNPLKEQQAVEYENPEDKPKEMLSKVDIFNLNYLRTGGNPKQGSKQSPSTVASLLRLPKVVHTSIFTHKMPKQRQRLKQFNQIVQQIRKKFDDRLRL